MCWKIYAHFSEKSTEIFISFIINDKQAFLKTSLPLKKISIACCFVDTAKPKKRPTTKQTIRSFIFLYFISIEIFVTITSNKYLKIRGHFCSMEILCNFFFNGFSFTVLTALVHCSSSLFSRISRQRSADSRS